LFYQGVFGSLVWFVRAWLLIQQQRNLQLTL